MHTKTDLLTDYAMSQFETKAGDVLSLDLPDGKGGFTKTECTVREVEITDAGTHPDSGEHLMRVTLTLE